MIRDVQINGQLTFTKPLTHNYDAVDTIVGSALVIGDMQATLYTQVCARNLEVTYGLMSQSGEGFRQTTMMRYIQLL